MASLHLRLLILLNLVARSIQADPIKDFCRRWGHSTAQIDGRLYIDGGMVSYNPPALNYSNPSLVFSDLRTSPPGGDLNMPIQHANLSKPGNIPSVQGGYIWADQTNKCFYQVGGEYPQGASPTDFSLWTYDIILDQWNSTNYKTSSKTLQRVSYGAGTQVESRGLGFYFGGWSNERTTPGWKGAAIATSGILQYDFTTGVLTNNSGPDDNIGRAEGQMVYLPRSDGGILVYFGGIEDPYRNGSYFPANMSKILIYDIASGRWYNQTAAGQAPPARRQFCADVTSADDSSSFNIYLYGGYGFGTPAAFNDAYVLSLPSFTWVRVYPTDGTDVGDFGHGGCSANIVNRNQMIVMGGWFPKETTCDAKDVQGQHNMVLGNNTINKKMWDGYDPKFTAYAVPEVVVSAIGGGPTGGATVRAPATWDHNNLRTYYTLTPSFKPRAATRALPATNTPSQQTPPPKKPNIGAIAGGAVGGLVALIAILCLILFCLHRRKKSRKAPEETAAPVVEPAELGVTPLPHEIATSPTSKYVAVHERQPSNDRMAYGSLPQNQARSTSYDQASAPSYHSTTPIPPAKYTTYGNVAIDQHALSPAHHGQSFSQHDNHGQFEGWQQQISPQMSNSPQQRQYSYPSPTSPQQPEHHQSQVYYPPPAETGQRTYHAQSAISEHRGSPTGTQYSGEPRNTASPHTSNMTTPAQFYAQPLPSATGAQYAGPGYR